MSQSAANPVTPVRDSPRLHATPATPPPGIRRWHVFVLLSAWCGILFFYGLTKGELYRTETLRAIIAAGFLKSGNWIVPTLYGEPLFTKPPGMYAAIALMSLPLGGVTEWSARLPSACAATATVFLFFWYFNRLMGRSAGLVAASILPASLMWLDKASAAEIDMMQVAWVSAGILFFLRALEAAEQDLDRTGDRRTEVLALRVRTCSRMHEVMSPDSPTRDSFSQTASLSLLHIGSKQWAWWLAALLCVSGGVLTKWTAPAFFYLTVIPLLCWRGQLRLLLGRHHLISAVVGAGVCLAWISTAVAITGWAPFYNTVSQEALMRLLPSYHHRPYPWHETLAHPFKLFATNLPWSLVALLTLRPGFARIWGEGGRRLLQAFHCWLWPNLIFWSIIPEHAARHSFPLFPGFAGLAAMVWLAWMSGKPQMSTGWQSRLKPVPVLVSLLTMWLVVKIVFVQVVVPARTNSREPRAKGEQLARMVPEGHSLYLFKLKDEGIMFYYGRQVIRLRDFRQLPSHSEPLYCILDESEWKHEMYWRGAEILARLADEQGAPIVLLKLAGRMPDSSG